MYLTLHKFLAPVNISYCHTEEAVEHKGDSDTSHIVKTLETSCKNLEKRLNELVIRGRIETIQTTTVLKLARVLRKVLDSMEICCHQTAVKRHQLRLMWTTTTTTSNDNNNNTYVNIIEYWTVKNGKLLSEPLTKAKEVTILRDFAI